MAWYGREYEEENKRQKITRQKTEAPAWLLDPFWNSLRKNAQRDPGEGMGLLLLWEEGHLKGNCPQASKLPPATCLVCRGPHWRRDCPLRCKPQGSDSQDNQGWRCLGVPTQVPVLTTPEEPQVLTTVGASQMIFFWTLGQLSLCLLKPLTRFLLIHYHHEAVLMRQMLLFQSSSKLQLRLCTVFLTSF